MVVSISCTKLSTSLIGESSLSSVLITIDPVVAIKFCVCCIDGDGTFRAVIIPLVASDPDDVNCRFMPLAPASGDITISLMGDVEDSELLSPC